MEYLRYGSMRRGLEKPVCCTCLPGKKEQARTRTRPHSHTSVLQISLKTQIVRTHKPFTSTSHGFHLHDHNHTVHSFTDITSLSPTRHPIYLYTTLVFLVVDVCSVILRRMFLTELPFPYRTPYTDTYHLCLQK